MSDSPPQPALRVVGSAPSDVPNPEERPKAPLQRWADLVGAAAPESELARLAFDHFHEMVFVTASRIMGTPWEAEDITQMVFENLVRRLREIRDPATLPGYLKTCTVRIALRQVRRQRWRRRRLEAFGPMTIPSDPPSRAALVRQLLGQLGEEERVAMVLKFVEQHAYSEMAEMMGVSVPTVRRRLASARAKLTAILGDDGLRTVFGPLEAAHD